MSNKLPERRDYKAEPFGRLLQSMNNYFHSKRMNGMLQQIDQFFAQPMFKNSFPIKVSEKENKFIITGQLPGIDKEQINVKINNNYITITIYNEDILTEENNLKNIKVKKQSVIKYSRIITLPFTINVKKVYASYKNGLLEIQVQKENGENITID